MIGRSVEALETTARGMRTPPASDAGKPAASVSSWWPTLPRDEALTMQAQACRKRGRRQAADAQSAARAHRRGGGRRAHRGAARADPGARRGPHASLRGQRAPADRRRRRTRAIRIRPRRAGLGPDAADRRRAHDPRSAGGAPAGRARASGLGAVGDRRQVAGRRRVPRHRVRQHGRRPHEPGAVVRPERGAQLHRRACRGAEPAGHGRLPLRAGGGDRPRHGLRRAEGDGLRLRQARRAGVPRRPGGAGRRCAFRPPTSAATCPTSA